MNASGRLAQTAAAPALENLGVIVVLIVVAQMFGAGRDLPGVPTAEVIVLGAGSTCAVALHAALQWWGARRTGARFRLHLGWRDPDVRRVLRRALPATVQAGLIATQVLTMLAVANQVAGGVIAFQIALNFYYLPIALVATPVALSLLPRLSRLVRPADGAMFAQTVSEGMSLVVFLAAPAATGYLVLAPLLADTFSVGEMNTSSGTTMVSLALMALAGGLLGQSVFMVATYSSYSRGDTVTPMRSMAVQALICIPLVLIGSQLGSGPTTLLFTGGGFAIANAAAAWHLTGRIEGVRRRQLLPLRSSIRALVAAATMAAPIALVAHVMPKIVNGGAGQVLWLSATVLIGAVTYTTMQHWLGAPEISWLRAGLRRSAAPTASGAEL
jgi:putative peptidoglycan lipid II flippase